MPSQIELATFLSWTLANLSEILVSFVHLKLIYNLNRQLFGYFQVIISIGYKVKLTKISPEVFAELRRLITCSIHERVQLPMVIALKGCAL